MIVLGIRLGVVDQVLEIGGEVGASCWGGLCRLHRHGCGYKGEYQKHNEPMAAPCGHALHRSILATERGCKPSAFWVGGANARALANGLRGEPNPSDTGEHWLRRRADGRHQPFPLEMGNGCGELRRFRRKVDLQLMRCLADPTRTRSDNPALFSSLRSQMFRAPFPQAHAGWQYSRRSSMLQLRRPPMRLRH
jgi:hypothetical protein